MEPGLKLTGHKIKRGIDTAEKNLLTNKRKETQKILEKIGLRVPPEQKFKEKLSEILSEKLVKQYDKGIKAVQTIKSLQKTKNPLQFAKTLQNLTTEIANAADRNIISNINSLSSAQKNKVFIEPIKPSIGLPLHFPSKIKFSFETKLISNNQQYLYWLFVRSILGLSTDNNGFMKQIEASGMPNPFDMITIKKVNFSTKFENNFNYFFTIARSDSTSDQFAYGPPSNKPSSLRYQYKHGVMAASIDEGISSYRIIQRGEETADVKIFVQLEASKQDKKQLKMYEISDTIANTFNNAKITYRHDTEDVSALHPAIIGIESSASDFQYWTLELGNENKWQIEMDLDVPATSLLFNYYHSTETRNQKDPSGLGMALVKYLGLDSAIWGPETFQYWNSYSKNKLALIPGINQMSETKYLENTVQCKIYQKINKELIKFYEYTTKLEKFERIGISQFLNILERIANIKRISTMIQYKHYGKLLFDPNATQAFITDTFPSYNSPLLTHWTDIQETLRDILAFGQSLAKFEKNGMSTFNEQIRSFGEDLSKLVSIRSNFLGDIIPDASRWGYLGATIASMAVDFLLNVNDINEYLSMDIAKNFITIIRQTVSAAKTNIKANRDLIKQYTRENKTRLGKSASNTIAYRDATKSKEFVETEGKIKAVQDIIEKDEANIKIRDDIIDKDQYEDTGEGNSRLATLIKEVKKINGSLKEGLWAELIMAARNAVSTSSVPIPKNLENLINLNADVAMREPTQFFNVFDDLVKNINSVEPYETTYSINKYDEIAD